MSGRTWLYADPHFYHEGVCKFTRRDGTKLRPWNDATQMTEDLINSYNKLVDDGDRVYILGDVAFSPGKFRDVMSRLKGRKVLVPGNHEPRRFDKICAYLDIEIRGYVVKKGFIMSHIPIHPGSMGRWTVNIHGHTHSDSVFWAAGTGFEDHQNLNTVDKRYRCVSVEQTDYKPILLDKVLEEVGLKNNY